MIRSVICGVVLLALFSCVQEARVVPFDPTASISGRELAERKAVVEKVEERLAKREVPAFTLPERNESVVVEVNSLRREYSGVVGVVIPMEVKGSFQAVAGDALMIKDDQGQFISLDRLHVTPSSRRHFWFKDHVRYYNAEAMLELEKSRSVMKQTIDKYEETLIVPQK